MWHQNIFTKKELQDTFENQSIPWEKLNNKTILVTGATGLIGHSLIYVLIKYAIESGKTIKIIAVVRNEKKAKLEFGILNYEHLEFIIGSMEKFPKVKKNVDYIIHGASQTASKFFAEKPVQTISTTIYGTEALLRLAQEKKVESMVYLSSMEVYGAPNQNILLTEADTGEIDCLSVRSCYSESKRMAENMCVCYWAQYGVPVKIIRLAQTFGPGVKKTDDHVFSQFSRSLLKGENLTLHTTGESTHMYLYTLDAVSAILTILLKGENGEAYNAANKKTYCSIKKMAENLILWFGDDRQTVEMVEVEGAEKMYPPIHSIQLSVEKLEKLGWTATHELKDMYLEMCKYMGTPLSVKK